MLPSFQTHICAVAPQLNVELELSGKGAHPDTAQAASSARIE